MKGLINRRGSKSAVRIALVIAALLVSAGIVYAAQNYRVNSSQNVQITEYGVCAQVTNGLASDIFVPTNSAAEWSRFRDPSYKPAAVTLGSCCAAGTGNACSSNANSCSQTNSGTIQCDGSCSASTPADPAGYGTGCSSAANNCGSTNPGTIQCDGSCSAGAPANVPDRYVCGDWFCVNSDEQCDTCYDGYDSYSCNCSFVCVDWDRNCGYQSGC